MGLRKMKLINELRFGTAGIPNSTPRPSTVNGIQRVKELGLNAMEVEFVRGIRLSEEKALEVRKVAKELDVVLTAHAPYYINLLSPDETKVKASIERIYQTARIAWIFDGWSITFHSGYYGKLKPGEAIKIVKVHIGNIVKRLKDEGIEIWVRPETTGGLAEFGSLEELLEVTYELEMVLPCVDFAHIYARSRGSVNTYEAFRNIMCKLEKTFGKLIINNMHIHMSGMSYGKRGEIKHLNLRESAFNYKDVLKVLKEFNVKGVVISESPNLEEDAILMLNYYKSL